MMPRLARDLTADPGTPGRRSGRETLSAADLRQMAVSEFTALLSGKTNKQIEDMLEVTGGGRGRDFEGIPDHAIIRVFTEGVRRTELTQMQTDGVLPDIDKFAESHRLLA